MSTVEVSPSKASRITGRVISTLVVLFLLMDGGAKIAKVPEVLKACEELLISESIIQGLGITLVVCTLIYAVPLTSVLGAILLTGYLGGAVATHVRMVGGPVFPIVFSSLFGVLTWLGLFLRDSRLRLLIPFRR